MVMTVVVLEDNAERVAIMRACLSDRFPMDEAHFFDEARDVIAYLDSHLSKTLVVALDNDLDMKKDSDGRCVDVGEGRQVAEFLPTKKAACPVVIHTMDSDSAAAIQEILRSAGWKTRRVVPVDDMNWIASDFVLRFTPRDLRANQADTFCEPPTRQYVIPCRPI